MEAQLPDAMSGLGSEDDPRLPGVPITMTLMLTGDSSRELMRSGADRNGKSSLPEKEVIFSVTSPKLNAPRDLHHGLCSVHSSADRGASWTMASCRARTLLQNKGIMGTEGVTKESGRLNEKRA